MTEYAEIDARLTMQLYQSLVMPFLRMLAHFDALDGDEEPDEPQPRYELLHPEDSYATPALAHALYERMDREFLCGSSV